MKDREIPQDPPNYSVPPLSVRLADDAASQLRSTADDHLGRSGLVKQVSTSIPHHVLAKIEVLADRLGKSRGAMIAWAAEIGAQLIIDRAGPEEDEPGSLHQAIKQRTEQLAIELSPEEY
jgi:ribosomal protein L16/L10AE